MVRGAGARLLTGRVGARGSEPSLALHPHANGRQAESTACVPAPQPHAACLPSSLQWACAVGASRGRGQRLAWLSFPPRRESAANLVRSGSYARQLRRDDAKGSEAPQTVAPSTYVSTYLKRYEFPGQKRETHSGRGCGVATARPLWPTSSTGRVRKGSTFRFRGSDS